MSNKQNFDIKSLKIGIASPERIREWSYGEITKPETINYKSLKPERYGLFDEVIFGPIKDYECSCGKYKKVKYKGRKCDKCEVEITESIVRRERMGSIELAAPIAHIWMTKELPNPSKISLLLDISYKDVEQVIYFVNYIILDAGDYTYNGEKIFKIKEIVDLSNPKNNIKTRNKLRRILSDIAEMIKKDPKKGKNDFDFRRAKTYCEALKERNLPFSANEVFGFITKYTNIKFGIGASAIKELLSKIDLDAEYNFIKNELKECNDPDDQYVKKLLRRLEVIKWVKESNNKPEWMVMDVIPVTPPDTRPIIQLDGGRFTTSDINTFYRKIIIRNERLKVLKNDFAPAILLNNECRMLQESVDSLFDNQSRKKPLVGRDKRPLKSLSNHLKGKQGLFRQNLLGKRVDYSGRSVIVVGPELKMYEVGIPAIMILKLFKPFIINELTKKEEKSLNPPLASSIKKAEEMILEQNSVIWPIVQKVIKDRPVLLNRAPTLHRLGIQAFKVKMIDGKAIRLHPLVTTAFNADFDGDQMAVHVPLSDEAVSEARLLMLGSWHILGAKDGKPIVTPTQDIILGNYYISREQKDEVGQGTIFNSIQEAKIAFENKAISINSIIGICTSAFKDKVFEKEGILITTIGKIIFNEALPDDFEYINSNFKNNTFLSSDDIIEFGQNIQQIIKDRPIQEPFGKSILSRLIDVLYKRYNYDLSIVPECLDKIKDLGFKYSTISATSISFFDVPEYNDKSKYILEAEHKVDELQKFAAKGFLNEDERYVKTIEVWNDVKDKVTKDIRKIVESDEFKNNSIVIMANSGARGNISNFTQLTGMRGLMSKSYNYDQKSKSKVIKDTIEIPIKHSFIEGLSVSEYFNSTYGARKGLTDTAMKTSKSGYMTRKLVDATQEVIVKKEDCGTDVGITVSEIIDTKNSQLIETLSERIINRFSVYDIINPNTNEIIVKGGELITASKAKEISNCNITEVSVRSPMYCRCSIGICQKCFGIDLSTNKLIEKGVAIGIIAAQSIGEPGTQLTMRTFHTGGVSGESNITQGFERLKQLFEFTPLKKWEKAVISEIDGKVTSITTNEKDFEIVVKNNLDTVKYTINNNSKLRVKLNDEIKAGDKICEGSINIFELLLISGVDSVRQYIIKEVQKVYRSQGIEISDKYIEVIINQLTNKCIIVSPGDSDYFIGQVITINKFKEISQKLFLENKNPPIIIPKIFGLEVAPSKSGSFLSAASFQDTKKILTDAATKGQIDYLLGLKENVILGKLIPAGTGLIDKEIIITKGKELIEKEY